MRAVVVGNGEITDYEYIKSRLGADDFIICADGGLRHIERLNITPDVVMGDFDSAKRPETGDIYEYPTDKDYTDGELAVHYAIERGFDELLLIGMTGSRLDHTITNIFLLAQHKNAYLIDNKNEIYLLDKSLKICGKAGKTLSIIPIRGDLEGVTAKGLKWQLNSETLRFAESRGMSNIILSDKCEITATAGMAVVVINDGE